VYPRRIERKLDPPTASAEAFQPKRQDAKTALGERQSVWHNTFMPKLKTPRATTLKRAGGKRAKAGKTSRRATTPSDAELAARQSVARRMFNPAAAAAARKAFLSRQRADHAG
jgi:hypothetical protein